MSAKIYTASGNIAAVRRRIQELNELRHDFKYPIEIMVEGSQMSYVFNGSAELDYFRAGFELASNMAKNR